MAQQPPRREHSTDLKDRKHGKVRVRVIDRISVDDVVLHLVHRELYRLSGGADPGSDVSPQFVDFLVREGYLV